MLFVFIVQNIRKLLEAAVQLMRQTILHEEGFTLL